MRAGAVLSASVGLALVAIAAAPAAAELRVANLWVYLNDYDVTVQVALLGAIPPSFHESIQSGVPSHVRFSVELWKHRRAWPDQLLQTQTVERQLLYSVLTKEYKVVSVSGETREPYASRDLHDAQRVLSEIRGLKLMPAAQLDPADLFYVRVRAEAALSGQNTFLTRLAGDAEETDWMHSSLLTVSRTQ
jgi:hypothetical protein